MITQSRPVAVLVVLVLCWLISDSPVRSAEPLASARAIKQLQKFLLIPRADRPDLEKQAFASVALTKSDTAAARQLLWADHRKFLRADRAEEMKNRRLTEGKHTMRFFYSVTGQAPKSGRSLYISMHGGGGAPSRVNDGQWENQKRLYRIPEGIYVAPRAPTDTWNLWHQPHIDRLFDRLIENLIVFENVDPNRVYLLGYSAGGDGVYQLAPRMADRFAAASMMAGHPNNASPINLRNLPFSIHVGERDAAYRRNAVAREWGNQLDQLEKTDPKGYPHWVKVYPGKGHWMDREDAAAIPWMAKFRRDPIPQTVVWEVNTHPRFYWLAVREPKAKAKVRATRTGQQIDLSVESFDQVMIRLRDDMLNLDEPIVVFVNGQPVFQKVADRTVGTLFKTLAERGDPAGLFSAEVVVNVPKL